MNKPFSHSQRDLAEKVSFCVQSSLSGTELIRALDGVHPIEIKAALLSVGTQDILHDALGDLSITGSRLHEIVRDDNPILSFWPFTPASAQRVADLAASFPSVALLGVPTVFNLLKSRFALHELSLFDRDDYLFSDRSMPGFEKCDLVSQVPERFHNKFDLVIADPPWYLDEYLAWLATAERIVRPGGTIIFVLFPEGIRASASHERSMILNLAKRMFAEIYWDEKRIEYETPSFEQVQMICHGIQPINWRTAELVIGKMASPKNLLPKRATPRRTEEWIERRLGSGRLFINLDVGARDTGKFLRTAESNSRFLSSPSLRNPGRMRANVLSSRGHGLYCLEPTRLIRMIEGVHTSFDIERSSRSDDCELFTRTAFDLWPRFIQLEPNTA
jgi:hypothetical protein